MSLFRIFKYAIIDIPITTGYNITTQEPRAKYVEKSMYLALFVIRKAGENMNLNGKMKKLQTAIVKKGLVIKINSSQFYSADQQRMITSYRICTPVTYYSEKHREWKVTDHEILKSCSMPEIIFCLVDIYKAVEDG